MARGEGRPLATSSLAVGCFAVKKGSLHSPRGRLVASLKQRKRLKYCSSCAFVRVIDFLDNNVQVFLLSCSRFLFSSPPPLDFYRKIVERRLKNDFFLASWTEIQIIFCRFDYFNQWKVIFHLDLSSVKFDWYDQLPKISKRVTEQGAQFVRN